MRDLIELISGRDLFPTQYNSDKIGIPYITGASNLLNERIIINRWTDTPSVVSHKGDLLITCKGTIGEMVFNDIGDVHIARQIMSIRCIGVNSLFIMLVLKSYVSQLQSGAKSFIPGISRDDILKLPFIMPPLAEQARIVNQVAELFTQVDAIEQNQADIDTLYEEFRKRTLTLAIQGKLVPQDPNDEPASVLLERIRAEKKVKLGKKYVDSYIYKGDDNCYYEHVAGRAQDELVEVPFDIPENWRFTRFSSLIHINGGYAFKSENYIGKETGIRVLRISDFNEDGFNQKRPVYHKYTLELKSFELEINDIIMCMTGGTVGKSYFVTELPEPMLVNQRVADIKINKNLNKKYCYYFILSPYIQQIIDDSKNSTNDNISVALINSFIMPVPPIAEQKRIVAKINEIFAML